MSNDKARGLYAKYHVERTDPTAQERHADCQYFVLDLTHDPHARQAALKYADEVERDYPNLADDLRQVVSDAILDRLEGEALA